jgi:hypothetical protein
MAVVSTYATAITNRDATPKVLSNPTIHNGMLRECVGTVESVSGDSIASKYFFCTLPSNARVSQVLLYCDDVGSTTIADFGLYKSTADGGAVADADFFGSAVSLKDGALNGTDITHESGVFDIDDVEKPLWQALGLTADPKINYDVVATLTAASDAAGTISLKVRYVL